MRFDRSIVVLKNYLGDTVMASPLVREVARRSEAIDLLGSPIVEQILRSDEIRARAHDPGNLSKVGQLMRTAVSIRRGHYDVAFVVNRSFRSALLTRLAGIKVRVGHATEGRAALLTHRVEYDEDRNEAECYLDLLRTLDRDLKDVDARPNLWVSQAEKAHGKELVEGGTIGIQPGARHAYKQIRTDVMRQVGQTLIAQGKRLVFLGGKEEAPMLAELGLEGVDLIGKTTIRETMGVLANVRLMIGGDTGVMHLAAALGCATVTAFGPTPAKKWGWFDAPNQVVQAPGGDIAKVDADTIFAAIGRTSCA